MLSMWALLIVLYTAHLREASARPMAAPAKAKWSGYLTERQLQRVREWMPIYRGAASMAGVPVLALPAIHYREDDLLDTWSYQPEELWVWRHRHHVPYRNIGGPFMLDLGANGNDLEFDRRIRAFEFSVAHWYGITPVPRVRDNFPFACLCAAQELLDHTKRPLFDLWHRVDREALARAMWGFNGHAAWQRTWRDSACVWNDPHRGRILMQAPDHRDRKPYHDERPGSLVIYDELVRRLGEQ